MNPNRLSIVFFAAALLLAGTAVAGLFVRFGADTDWAQAQATERPSFAGVVAANSWSGGTTATLVRKAAPVFAPSAARAVGPLGAVALPDRAGAGRPLPGGEEFRAGGPDPDGLLPTRRYLVVACPEARDAFRAAVAPEDPPGAAQGPMSSL